MHHRLDHGLRNERAPNGGAFLPRLHRHLLHDLLHEEVELLAARRRVGPKHREVERVGLGVEADVVVEDRRLRPERACRLGRAGERHGALGIVVIEEVAGAAAHELDGTVGEDPRLDHGAEHRFGEVGGQRRRLHDRGHAGEQRRRQLLEHPPDRKVEGIDVHRHALERDAYVPADEGAALRQRFHLAVDKERLGHHGRVNVELRIGRRCAVLIPGRVLQHGYAWKLA